jgi:hypothetical protein
MARIRTFLSDRRGAVVERLAILCGAIALASVASVHYLEIASRDGGSSIVALFRPARAPGVDYTPTASIRKQAGQTVLDPCTGKPK